MSSSNSIICTLCEGDYFLGFAALVNSLVKSGYTGPIVCGYKGSLDAWNRISKSTSFSSPAGGVEVILEKYEAEQHFTQVKPQFMRLLLSKSKDQPERIFYFDPDIVVKCEWDFFEQWADLGIALCEDINSPMLRNDPRRLRWKKFFSEEKGFSWRNDLDIYVNGGFVGLSKQRFGFLSEWESVQSHIFSVVPKTTGLKYETPTAVFYSPDQDALNIAVCCSEHTGSVMAKEAMDFQPGGFIMSHAIGPKKPWQRSFFKEALRGVPPRNVDKLFLTNSKTPIQIYGPAARAAKLVDVTAASLLSRFFKR